MPNVTDPTTAAPGEVDQNTADLVERFHATRLRPELDAWAGNSTRVMDDVYTRVGVDFDGSELAGVSPLAARRGVPDNVVPIRSAR